MTIAFGAIGAKSAGGTTTTNVDYPASPSSTDLLILGDVGWLSSAGVNAISGWTVRQQAGGTGTAADAHTTTCAVFYKQAVGGETGSVTVTRATATGQVGIMARYTTSSGAWDSIVQISGTDNTHGTNRSATTGTVSLAPGDVLSIVAAVDTDAALTVSAAVSATGITFGTVTRRTSGAGVADGPDGNIEMFDVAVTSGTGTVAVTVTLTTGTSQCGPIVVTRMREVASTPPSEGASTGALAWGGAAVGQRIAAGVAAGALAFAGVAAGSVVRSGSGSGSLAFAGAATSSTSHRGAAAGGLSFVGAASGVAPVVPPKAGSASGTLSWTGSLAGKAPRRGTAAGSLAFTGTAQGATAHRGSSTGALAWSGAASGQAPVVPPHAGSSAGTASWAGSAAGATARLGAAGGSLLWTGAASGVAPTVGMQEGSASGALAWQGQADGSSVHRGSSAGVLGWAGTSAGDAPAVGAKAGSASGALSWPGVASGRADRAGAASSDLSWTGLASGVIETAGSAAGDLSWTGSVDAATDGTGTPVARPSLTLTLPPTELGLTIPDTDATLTLSTPTLALTIPTTHLEVPVMGLHVGDSAPRFTATLTSDKQPVNLTGASVKVHLRKPSGVLVELPATVDTPATDGKVTGGPWGDMLDTAGDWKSEVEVTWADDSVQTFGPETFAVRTQIA